MKISLRAARVAMFFADAVAGEIDQAAQLGHAASLARAQRQQDVVVNVG